MPLLHNDIINMGIMMSQSQTIIYVKTEAERAERAKSFPRAQVIVIGSELIQKIGKRLERESEERYAKQARELSQRKGGNSKKAFELGKKRFALLDEAIGPDASLEVVARAMGKTVNDIQPQRNADLESENEND